MEIAMHRCRQRKPSPSSAESDESIENSKILDLVGIEKRDGKEGQRDWWWIGRSA